MLIRSLLLSLLSIKVSSTSYELSDGPFLPTNSAASTDDRLAFVSAPMKGQIPQSPDRTASAPVSCSGSRICLFCRVAPSTSLPTLTQTGHDCQPQTRITFAVRPIHVVLVGSSPVPHQNIYHLLQNPHFHHLPDDLRLISSTFSLNTSRSLIYPASTSRIAVSIAVQQSTLFSNRNFKLPSVFSTTFCS